MYYHKLFLRCRPDLCLCLVRCKPLDERDQMKCLPSDFYSMEPVVSNEALQGMASAVATELSMGPSQTVLSGQNTKIASTIRSTSESEHITSIEEETGVSFMALNHNVTERCIDINLLAHGYSWLHQSLSSNTTTRCNADVTLWQATTTKAKTSQLECYDPSQEASCISKPLFCC